jgi:hypothetical protein
MGQAQYSTPFRNQIGQALREDEGTGMHLEPETEREQRPDEIVG